MSAKNWRVCPRCVRYANTVRDSELMQVRSNYGVIPLDQWAEEFNDAKQEVKTKEAMREDYDIGLNEEGKFVVNYRAWCDSCGFEFKYSHEDQAATKS